MLCPGLVDRGHDVTGIDLTSTPAGFTGAWATPADAAEAAHVGGDYATSEYHRPAVERPRRATASD
ncbi:MAG TPA: hypothetical protein VFJ09_12515 [Nocardioidaceae bacterium]|nr:hypothetical protein [Nocardioidaceae bacterium]